MSAPVTFRPHVLRIVAVVSSVVLLVLTVVGWFALPLSLRVLFTWSQRLTLLAILAFVVGVIWVLAASYVRADEVGLRFRNGLRTHAVAWPDVHKIVLRPGDPWAILLIAPPGNRGPVTDADADRRGAMGIQATDGERAQEAVRELRRRRAEAAAHRG